MLVYYVTTKNDANTVNSTVSELDSRISGPRIIRGVLFKNKTLKDYYVRLQVQRMYKKKPKKISKRIINSVTRAVTHIGILDLLVKK